MKQLLILLVLLPMLTVAQTPPPIWRAGKIYEFHPGKNGGVIKILKDNPTIESDTLRIVTYTILNKIVYRENNFTAQNHPDYNQMVSMIEKPDSEFFIKETWSIKKMNSFAEFFKPQAFKITANTVYNAKQNEIVPLIKTEEKFMLNWYLIGLLICIPLLWLSREFHNKGEDDTVIDILGIGCLVCGTTISLWFAGIEWWIFIPVGVLSIFFSFIYILKPKIDTKRNPFGFGGVTHST